MKAGDTPGVRLLESSRALKQIVLNGFIARSQRRVANVLGLSVNSRSSKTRLPAKYLYSSQLEFSLRLRPNRTRVFMTLQALRTLALLLLLTTASACAKKCPTPTAPDTIPRGHTATFEQMVAAQQAVKAFDTATNAYIACLQRQSDAELLKLEQRESDAKNKAERKKKLLRVLIQKQNAAVDVDQALAARFNEQLRVFKAKGSK